MGCCGSGSTTTPPFRYSPNNRPLPREKPSSQRCARLEGPKTQGFIASICCEDAPIDQFACGWDKSVLVYDIKKQEIAHQFQPHQHNVSKCRFLQGGNALLTSSFDTTLKLWALDNLHLPKRSFEGHQMTVASFCISMDQKKLCSGSRDQSVVVWDMETGQKLSEKTIARNTVTCMEWIPTTESNFVQCSEDLTIRIWDTRELRPTTEIPLSDNHFAYCCAVDPTGTKLLTGHYACNDVGSGVFLWDLRKANEGSYIWRYLEHKESVMQTAIVKFDEAGQEVAISASKDARLKVIKLEDGMELGSYQDEARWPFTTFGVMGSEGCKMIVAGLCKKSVSKITACTRTISY